MNMRLIYEKSCTAGVGGCGFCFMGLRGKAWTEWDEDAEVRSFVRLDGCGCGGWPAQLQDLSVCTGTLGIGAVARSKPIPVARTPLED
jgi:hypothetical protein